MFHGCGWTFPWAITAAFATQVSGDRPRLASPRVDGSFGQITLRTVDVTQIWYHILKSGVTHYCAAPTVQVCLDLHESR